MIQHNGKDLFVSNPEAFFYELLNALGLKEAEMFPLTFRLRVPVADKPDYSGGQLP